MCGIGGVAFVDPRRWADQATIDRMMAALAHRGPDADGCARVAGAALGTRRLAIVDLETGDQPITNEDGAVFLVCNGEIYNAPELRAQLQRAGHRFRSRSDVEVIVHLYEDAGVECLTRLRGMFAIALWDARRRRLMLARDRFGIKPLVYAARPEGVWFASEAKAILAAGVAGGEADPRAIDDLFRFAFVAGPRTLFSNIRKLPPAHVALYEDGRLSLRRYWAMPEAGGRSGATAREWAEALRVKLEESVRLHLRSDVPVGAWLSPGVDSSAVASLAMRHLGRALPTVTLAFEDPSVDETRRFPTLDTYAGYETPNRRAWCGADSLALLPRAVWHMEEPTAWGVEIPRMLLAEAAAREVKVVLTGEGSDEIFGGYPHFRLERISRLVATLPLAVRRALLAPLVPAGRPMVSRLLLAPRALTAERYARLVGPMHADERFRLFSPDLRRRLDAAPEAEAWVLPPERMRSRHWFDRLRRCDLELRLPDLINHSLDRGAMAYGVEARVPFLDHELVEFVGRIPAGLNARGGMEKSILREALRGVVPDEIRRRRKAGMGVPYEAWMAGPLPAFAEDLLSERRLRDKGYFDPGAVQRLRREQREGRRRLGALLMAVLGVQLWDETFLHGSRAAAPS
ncbi:MAG: asparagine synthase (glutamine-hydrolyzing) [Acidobacteria bacterium]|nr:MAG: asparagine synthase (glutamine-hydrolyzing) [Acidobacteriota bacterium]